VILCVLPGLWASAAPLPDSVLPCAPCHDRENSAQIEEWLASPYSETEGGRQCTDCHRRRCSGTDAQTPVDDLTAVSSQHLGQAVRLAVAAVCSDRSVSVEVAVSNMGVGHLLPTSRQGRALTLEVIARDADRTSLSARSATFRARLPPFATDVSRYRFDSPGVGPVYVVARLVWVPATGPRLLITRAETACETPRVSR
jgi:hypothetical protein